MIWAVIHQILICHAHASHIAAPAGPLQHALQVRLFTARGRSVRCTTTTKRGEGGRCAPMANKANAVLLEFGQAARPQHRRVNPVCKRHYGRIGGNWWVLPNHCDRIISSARKKKQKVQKNLNRQILGEAHLSSSLLLFVSSNH